MDCLAAEGKRRFHCIKGHWMGSREVKSRTRRRGKRSTLRSWSDVASLLTSVRRNVWKELTLGSCQAAAKET